MSKDKDLATVTRFIEVFCRQKHKAPRATAGVSKGGLCRECSDLLEYATDRIARCPMDPKPKCKNCTVHCYQPEYRRRIKEVMKFSGLYFVKRGRIDWLIQYFT